MALTIPSHARGGIARALGREQLLEPLGRHGRVRQHKERHAPIRSFVFPISSTSSRYLPKNPALTW